MNGPFHRHYLSYLIGFEDITKSQAEYPPGLDNVRKISQSGKFFIWQTDLDMSGIFYYIANYFVASKIVFL
jgi:hypothetical protein